MLDWLFAIENNGTADPKGSGDRIGLSMRGEGKGELDLEDNGELVGVRSLNRDQISFFFYYYDFSLPLK